VQSALWGIAAAIAGSLLPFVAAVIIGEKTAIPIFAMIAAPLCLIAIAHLRSAA